MHSLINLPHVESISYSPHINVFYRQHSIRLTLDTGATTNVIRATFAKAINLPLTPASQLARQADGVTPLHVIGEVYSELTRVSIRLSWTHWSSNNSMLMCLLAIHS